MESTHPSNDELSRFISGRMHEPGRLVIEQHIMNCESCCETLGAIDDDRLVCLVRDTTPGRETGLTAHPYDSETLRHAPVAREVLNDLLDHPRYVIGRCLGFGGMGTVYKARHRLMDRDVALKIIHPELVDRPDAQQQFLIEVKAAALLSHPNIITAYDAEQVGNTHLLVMEFLDGESLADHVLREGPLPADLACSLIRQAADGLQHAHEQGLVHRDIKPSNLMIIRTGREIGPVKILDFGLARIGRNTDQRFNEGRAERTAFGGLSRHDSMVLGTLQYIAPEQLDNARAADTRSDIYSLGCTLHYLLTGRPPFYGESLFDLVQPGRTTPGEGLLRENPAVPTAVSEILDRMLATDPEQRFGEPRDVVLAIDSAGVAATDIEDASDIISGQRVSLGGKHATITVWSIGMLICLVAALVAAGLLTDRDERGPAAFPAPVANADADVHALLIVPAVDAWFEDYDGLLTVLSEADVSTRIAASQDVVTVADKSGTIGTLNVNLKLTDADAGHFDVIIVSGGNWSELDSSPHVLDTLGNLLRSQLNAEDHVGAICGGQTVLGRLGLLSGIRVARPPPVVQSNEWEATFVDRQPVVTDGLIVSGGDTDDVKAFAIELLRQIGLPR